MTTYPTFSYLNSVNTKTVLKNPDFKGYSKILVARGLAQNIATITDAKTLNENFGLWDKWHYTLAYLIVDKNKSFAKWSKKEEVSEEISMICSVYNVNIDRAKEYLRVLNKDFLDHLKQEFIHEPHVIKKQ